MVLSQAPYHSGRGDDVSDFVKWARSRFPGKKVLTIGYSMSASMILNLRSERIGSEQPEFAIAINPPIDLEYSSKKLITGLSKIYGQKFTSELREIIHGLIEKKVVAPEYCIPEQANLWDVDEIFTAPLSGFKSANHYYEMASSKPHLEKIRENTLIIAAEDDPFIDFTDMKKMSFSKNVEIRYFQNGGHVGFVSGWKKKWSDVFLNQLMLSLRT